MNKFLDSKVWLAAALAIACAVLFYFYKEVIQHPGNYLFGGGGDAVKNYFTFAWHVKYDESWLHFAGSNYPYGEHVCYTDGHPIVSLLLGNFEIVKTTGRHTQLVNLFADALAIAINKNGSPKHPLYCKSDSPLIPFVSN